MATNSYTKQTWEDAPSTNSPISADRLNHMETGIKDNNTGVRALETAVGNVQNLSTSSKEVVGSINEINQHLTWEHTQTLIQGSITDTSLHTINTSGYKSIKIRCTIPGGGASEVIINLNEIKCGGTDGYKGIVFGEMGYNSAFGGFISFKITSTSIQAINITKGSSITGNPSLAVFGLK